MIARVMQFCSRVGRVGEVLADCVLQLPVQETDSQPADHGPRSQR